MTLLETLDALRDLCDDQREQFDEIALPLRTALKKIDALKPVAWTTKRAIGYGGFTTMPVNIWEEKGVPLYTHPAPIPEDKIDAERYRALREMHWSYGGLCVAYAHAVKLGFDCPSESRLDDLLDEIIAAAPRPGDSHE